MLSTNICQFSTDASNFCKEEGSDHYLDLKKWYFGYKQSLFFKKVTVQCTVVNIVCQSLIFYVVYFTNVYNLCFFSKKSDWDRFYTIYAFSLRTETDLDKTIVNSFFLV